MISLVLATGDKIFCGNQSIELKWSANLVNDSIIPGILSYPFEIPGTPENLRALKYAHDIHSRALVVDETFPSYLNNTFTFGVYENVQLYWYEHPFIVGTLKLIGVRGSTINVVFSGGAGALSQIAKLQLNDIEYGGDRSVSAANQAAFLAHMSDTIANPDNFDYVFAPFADLRFLTEDPTLGPNGEIVLRAGRDEIVNFYDSLQRGSPPPLSPWTLIDHRYFAPLPYVRYVFEHIFNTAGFSLSNNPFMATELNRLVHYNSNYTWHTLFTSTGIINLKNEVPRDVTVGEYLNGLSSLFSLHISVKNNNKAASVFFKKDLANLSIFQDRSQYEQSTKSFEFQELKGYKLIQQQSKFDAFTPLPNPELIIGNGEVEINTMMSRPAMSIIQASASTTNRFWMPSLMNGGRVNVAEKKWIPYLMFYRGMMTHDLLAQAPTLSSTEENSPYALTVPFNYSLAWQGNAGLYEKFHKPWLDRVASTRVARAQIPMDFDELLEFDPIIPQKVGSAYYIPREYSIRIGKTIGNAEIVALKIQ